MPPPLSLEAIQVLDAIERHGSFAAAAAALHRVPSAVSYSIARLEADLGVALFDRSGHRASLTEAGRLLLEQGRHLLASAERLTRATRDLAAGYEQQLTVAVDSLFALDPIWPVAAEFQAAHPGTDLRLREEVLGGTWEALADGEAALAIGVADRPSGLGLSTREIGRVAFVFAAAPKHPIMAEPLPLTAESVARHRAVAVADSARRAAPLTTGLLANQPRLTVPSMAAKIEAQARGLGVGFLPRHRIGALLAAGELVALPLAEPRPDSRVFMAWRQDNVGRALGWLLRRLDRATLDGWLAGD